MSHRLKLLACATLVWLVPAVLQPAYCLQLSSEIKSYREAEQAFGRGDAAAARKILDKAIETNANPPAANVEAYCDLLDADARLYSKVNDRRAEELYRRALELRQRYLWREHPETMDERRELARLCFTLHKRAEGVRLLEEELQIESVVFGASSPKLLPVLERLAQAQGESAKKAAWLYERAAQIDATSHSSTTCENLAILKGLASSYERTGQNDKASQIVERMVALPEFAEAEYRWEYSHRLVELVNHYASKSQWATAVKYGKQLLSMHDTALNPQELRSARHQIAVIFDKAKEPMSERKAYLGRFALYSASQGIAAAALEECIAETDAKITDNDLQKARILFARACRLAKAVPQRRGDVLDVARRLIGGLKDAHKFAEAVEVTKVLISMCGEEDREVLMGGTFTLGELYLCLRDLDKAEPLYLSCLAMQRKTASANPHLIVWTLSTLAGICQERGNWAEAKRYREAELLEAKREEPSAPADVAAASGELAQVVKRLKASQSGTK